MSPHHSIAILLAAISFASAQDLPHPTRLLTNPVQPPGFSDDPALTTPRPLVIITPPEVIYGDSGSTLDYTPTPDTTVPYQDEVPFETDAPIETTTTTTAPAVPSTSSSPFAASTSLSPLSPLPTAAITTASSTTTTTAAVASTTTTTTATIADDAEAQVASTSIDISPAPFIGPRFVEQSAVSSMANPASMPTAFASAAAGLIAIVGLAMAL